MRSSSLIRASRHLPGGEGKRPAHKVSLEPQSLPAQLVRRQRHSAPEAAAAARPPRRRHLRSRRRYTGLAAALELAEAGYRVVVLEAQRIGWGASVAQRRPSHRRLRLRRGQAEALVGHPDARRMFDLSREGLRWLRDRIDRHAIACDWRDGHAQGRSSRASSASCEPRRTNLRARYDHPVEWWDRERLRGELASDRTSAHFMTRTAAICIRWSTRWAGARGDGGRRGDSRGLARGRTGARRAAVLKTAHGQVHCDFAVIAGNCADARGGAGAGVPIMPVGTYIAATAR
jgi:gamma-glutamylputrescine oxidase